jgi:hypothetical protein
MQSGSPRHGLVDAPPEQGTLSLQLQRQGAALSDLHERIGHLESRLGGVLQNDSPKDSSATPTAPINCALAEMASSIADGIENAARRVTSIRDRVDV